MIRSLIRLLVVFALTGCNSLTSVDAPDVVQPKDYATVAGASALATGARVMFTAAFAGGAGLAQNWVIGSGVLADELVLTGTHLDGQEEWDSRNPIEPSRAGAFIYEPLQRSRINSLTAIEVLQKVAPDSTARMGELFSYLGFVETFLGEGFCSGIPLSQLDAAFRPVYGEQLTGAEMYEHAITEFDSALAYGADSARITQLAAIGKGRALLNLGRFSDAAQAVSAVPTDFVDNAIFVTGVHYNGIYVTGFENRLTVPDREGTNGLDWRSAADPRVALINRSPELLGDDGVTEVWAFVPYQASDAPVPIATGIEARLIEAEAALQGGDAMTWLAIHNALRTTVPGLDPLADPGTPAAREDLHFRERAFWLFYSGHRLGDVRRLIRQYGRASESVFPVGSWRENILYGTAVNMAPGSNATTNPHFHGCLDRAP